MLYTRHFPSLFPITPENFTPTVVVSGKFAREIQSVRKPLSLLLLNMRLCRLPGVTNPGAILLSFALRGRASMHPCIRCTRSGILHGLELAQRQVE